MAELTLSFEQGAKGSYPLLTPAGWPGAGLAIAVPVACSYLDGSADELAYASVAGEEGESTWSRHGATFTLADSWSQPTSDRVRLERRLKVSYDADADLTAGAGFQFHLALDLGAPGADGWRFFAPGILYSPDQFAGQALTTFCDGRLAYPLVAAYHQASGATVCLSRVRLAAYDNPPLRPQKESRFLQQTDLGSLGYSREGYAAALHLYWPYHEGERSAALDAAGTPAAAFYPLTEDAALGFCYEIYCFEAEDFSAAVLGAFKNAYEFATPEPPTLPFTLPEAVELRLDSLAKTYAEWEGGAGFILNFDPEQGYDTQPKAFGASFTEHRMNDSHSILEYGFTGRQLNAAYVLARRDPAAWLERGAWVTDFLVNKLAQPSGWIFTLYHLDKKRPIYTCGDPDGAVMHYLALSPRPGNYLRMMVEAAGDLLLNYTLQRQHGSERGDWLAVARRFGDFLIRAQTADGAWYRAYAPGGEPLTAGWFGASGQEAKSGTAIPVPFLLALADLLGPEGGPYVEAAHRAGRYVLQQQVAHDEYRGGTLDNPNVVDKEASMLAMKALLRLYEQSGSGEYLSGAERAARLATSWNLIWNIPPVPGTRLAGAGVNSIGWGGINSIWGAGVGDIYSLFFAGDLLRLGRLIGEPLYEAVADLIAHGTAQILSYSGNLFNFADTGMQPEGISFCPQGVDSGLIAKGDIWGGLGWIYTAGTFGLQSYLGEKRG